MQTPLYPPPVDELIGQHNLETAGDAPLFQPCTQVFKKCRREETHEISRLEYFFNLCGIRSENSQNVTPFLCRFVKKQQKKSFSPSPASKIMMLVAKATVLTQVAGPSCEMRPVIGLSTDRLQIKHFDWLAGWLAAAGAPADRDSGESIDSIGWQTVDTHTHTRT